MPNLTWQKVILVLAAIGAATAVWLISIHVNLTSGEAALRASCNILPMGGSGGCEQIALSKYSDIFGIPLAAFALGFYFTVFSMAAVPFFVMKPDTAPFRFAFTLSTLALLVTFVMMFISITQVQAFCQGCFVLWVVNFLLFFATFLSLNESFGKIFSAIGGALQIEKDLLMKFLSTAGVCYLVAILGSVVVQSSGKKTSHTESAASAVRRYKNAVRIAVPDGAFADGQVKGAKEGAVMSVIKFADFQCFACKFGATKFKPFFLRNKDKVQFAYRHFPLDGRCNSYVPSGSHHLACLAALATNCAGKQGKFFEYHDFVFDSQDSLSGGKFDDFAQSLGLNMDEFKACVQEANYDKIRQDIEWAEMVGVNSTPTFVINGKKMAGALMPEQWEAILEEVQKEKAAGAE